MCRNTQFGNKFYIVCDHPPPVDVMLELLGQGRFCVAISLCVVPDASIAICVCSEFISFLPNNFSWSLHLACCSRVVSISDTWCLGAPISHGLWRILAYQIQSVDGLERAIQAHSVPLILQKGMKTCFGFRHSSLFAEVSSPLLIQSAKYFIVQKAFLEHRCAPCGLNYPIGLLLMARICVFGLLESWKWTEKINLGAPLELIIWCLPPRV